MGTGEKRIRTVEPQKLVMYKLTIILFAGPQPLPEEHERILRELDCYLGEGLDKYYSYDFVFPWDE